MSKNFKNFATVYIVLSLILFCVGLKSNSNIEVTYTDDIENTVTTNIYAVDNLDNLPTSNVSSIISFTNNDATDFTVTTESQEETQEDKKDEDVNPKAFSGINKYSNDDLSFEYLSSWSPTDTAENSEIDFLINGRNAMFSIIKEAIPENFTVQDYVNSTKKTLQQKENSTITSIQTVSHNSIEGSCIIYEVTNGDNTSVVNEFVTIHNKAIYVFTYYTDLAKYENYLTAYNNLLDSLEFTN